MDKYKPLMPTTPMFSAYHDACSRSHDAAAVGDLITAETAAIEAQAEADRLMAVLPKPLAAVFQRCRIARMMSEIKRNSLARFGG